jgi:hypothetical protein
MSLADMPEHPAQSSRDLLRVPTSVRTARPARLGQKKSNQRISVPVSARRPERSDSILPPPGRRAGVSRGRIERRSEESPDTRGGEIPRKSYPPPQSLYVAGGIEKLVQRKLGL